jgi:hypothetical protein
MSCIKTGEPELQVQLYLATSFKIRDYTFEHKVKIIGFHEMWKIS